MTLVTCGIFFHLKGSRVLRFRQNKKRRVRSTLPREPRGRSVSHSVTCSAPPLMASFGHALRAGDTALARVHHEGHELLVDAVVVMPVSMQHLHDDAMVLVDLQFVDGRCERREVAVGNLLPPAKVRAVSMFLARVASERSPSCCTDPCPSVCFCVMYSVPGNCSQRLAWAWRMAGATFQMVRGLPL